MYNDTCETCRYFKQTATARAAKLGGNMGECFGAPPVAFPTADRLGQLVSVTVPVIVAADRPACSAHRGALVV